MKVFKNKKQRIVALFLSLVFAFMLVPFTDAYAGSVVDIGASAMVVSADGELELPFKVTGNASPVYCVYINGLNQWVFVSKTPFNSVYYDKYGSEEYDHSSSNWVQLSDGTKVSPAYYYCAYGNFGRVDGKWLSDFVGPHYRINANDMSNPTALYLYALVNGDTTGFDCSNAGSEGNIDNPIYDDDIGTLIISKSKMYEESNGEDVNDLYNLFSWKMKTNTGFSLSDNKYARTFIQVRVESKCVVYDDRRHTKIHKNFDNYGEKAMLINSHPVDSQPLKISYLTDIPNVLPKTHAEIHNPVFTGYNYTLYFRVVCTDDLAVIPSDTSEWHCGGWRALDCNADILVGQSDTTENSSFDDNDNWVPGGDDGNNSIEAGSNSVHDTDDAKDDFNNSSSAVDSSVNGAISTMQSLLDMVRYVPQIISTIFSFLPSWCLNIVGMAFVALVVLIIYKLVRG